MYLNTYLNCTATIKKLIADKRIVLKMASERFRSQVKAVTEVNRGYVRWICTETHTHTQKCWDACFHLGTILETCQRKKPSLRVRILPVLAIPPAQKYITNMMPELICLVYLYICLCLYSPLWNVFFDQFLWSVKIRSKVNVILIWGIWSFFGQLLDNFLGKRKSLYHKIDYFLSCMKWGQKLIW